MKNSSRKKRKMNNLNRKNYSKPPILNYLQKIAKNHGLKIEAARRLLEKRVKSKERSLKEIR